MTLHLTMGKSIETDLEHLGKPTKEPLYLNSLNPINTMNATNAGFDLGKSWIKWIEYCIIQGAMFDYLRRQATFKGEFTVILQCFNKKNGNHENDICYADKAKFMGDFPPTFFSDYCSSFYPTLSLSMMMIYLDTL